MTDMIVINDRKYHAIRVAADEILYSPDYITRLAREGKVAAIQLGRRWYVHVGSLKAYADVQEMEQEIRGKHLRQQRMQERSRVTAVVASPSHHSIEFQIVAIALGVLLLGVVFGSQLGITLPERSQVATVITPLVVDSSDPLVPQGALEPVFTTDVDQVSVTNDRQINRPEVERGGWQYIEYE